ncbi:hypothetical protein [Nocardiopsis metallicus]|uniref:Uncharacterized protein n=1 Tax=Nocardiopsis metallicus TaxID=179819 RepID=A0A840WCI3_9ACTN|nr:hypothetical protein [Nocardiopsis metallicus]MBB5488946.1 hypothetical protein [Nocardiopsis metallicus]
MTQLLRVQNFSVSSGGIAADEGQSPARAFGELLDRFHLEVVPGPSGVAHQPFWRE